MRKIDMSKMKKSAFVLLSLFLLRQLCFGEDKVININLGDNIDFSGDGVVLGRTCNSQPEICSAAIPYHGGYYVNFNFNIKVNEHVHIEDILTAENQSFSAGYSSQNVLKNRLAAFYETGTLKLRAGNLGRIKSGNGLTIDELYSEGISLVLKFPEFNIDMTQSGAGLVLYEDLYIFQLSDKNRRFGLYANMHRGQTYPVRDVVYTGMFMKYPLNADTAAYAEYSTFNGNSFKFFSGVPAYLLGVRFNKKNEKFNLDAKFENRFYSDGFNKSLRYLPRDTFFALEEEDKRFNNWWDYLYIFGEISTLSFALNADYSLNERIKLFTDYEYIGLSSKDNILNYKASGKVNLYKSGFSYYINKDRNAYFSYNVSNKFLNRRDTGMIYNLYDTNYSSFEFHFKF